MREAAQARLEAAAAGAAEKLRAAVAAAEAALEQESARAEEAIAALEDGATVWSPKLWDSIGSRVLLRSSGFRCAWGGLVQ